MSQQAVRGCDDLYRFNPFDLPKVQCHVAQAVLAHVPTADGGTLVHAGGRPGTELSAVSGLIRWAGCDRNQRDRNQIHGNSTIPIG